MVLLGTAYKEYGQEQRSSIYLEEADDVLVIIAGTVDPGATVPELRAGLMLAWLADDVLELIRETVDPGAMAPELRPGLMLV